MVGQKQRIIRRFEKQAKKKQKKLESLGLGCACGKCNLAQFSLKEIKEIIGTKDFDECVKDNKEVTKK